MNILRAFGVFFLFWLTACDQGIEPPERQEAGAIEAVISYSGSWPAGDSLHDLRFVALKFVPKDTADLVQLNRLVFSPQKLDLNVPAQTVVLTGVPTGAYVYSGVAQRYTPNPFTWRPVGLYSANNGIFHVMDAETTTIAIDVNFQHLPPFPP